jgi:hypothetical protein
MGIDCDFREVYETEWVMPEGELLFNNIKALAQYDSMLGEYALKHLKIINTKIESMREEHLDIIKRLLRGGR